MIDTTVKVYATRAAASLAMALAAVLLLVVVDRSDARQNPTQARGHATLTGLAHAIDGDTLLVGGIRVRLEGIDAPEVDQTCTTARGTVWECGAAAHKVLARLVGNDLVSCEERGLDKMRNACRKG